MNQQNKKERREQVKMGNTTYVVIAEESPDATATAFEITGGLVKRHSEQETQKQENSGTVLKFTKKEISKMPERFRKEFLINDYAVKCRRRKSGKHTTNYEIRYRKHGFNIAVSANDIAKAKDKFLQAIQDADSSVKKCTQAVPDTFCEFAEYYFETYRKRKVSEGTFRRDIQRYKSHIKGYFGSTKLKKITPLDCQAFIDRFVNKGQTKTANEMSGLLNAIFKMAIAHGLIKTNPLAVVYVEKHSTTHGQALTKEEERKLLDGAKGTRYERLFAIALYTGMRPNEFKTASVQGDFIVAKNSKRKNGKVEYKRIPIIQALRPYVADGRVFDFPTEQKMRNHFNEILPEHKLYDLRTTFYSRCDECGVAEPARDEFVGHSRSVLNSTYSHLSDEYLLREGAKLAW